MQILNESGREPDAAAGSRSPTKQAESRSTQYADTRLASSAQDDGRRLSPEREAQIRQRVMDGTYNSLSIVDEVARRIIRSADL